MPVPPLPALARRIALWGCCLGLATAAHAPLLLLRPRTTAQAPAELVALAQQGLVDRGRGFDYAGFFLRDELGEAAAGPAKARLEAMVRGDGADGSYEGAVLSLLSRLFEDAGLGHYRRERSKLSSYLIADDQGGNCEAQTKLLVSALTTMSLAPPPGFEVGVQVFADHVQAVVIDRARDEVWNILTGKRELRPAAPVYRPQILLHAYLMGHGTRPEVQARHLLLWAGEQEGGPATPGRFKTDSRMVFPRAAPRFEAGEPPERAEVPFPLPASKARRDEGEGLEVVDRAAFLASSDEAHLFAMDRVESPFGVAGQSLVFRLPEHAEAYRALGTTEQRQAYLLSLTERALADELSRPTTRAVEASLGSPLLLATMGPDEVAAGLSSLRRIEGIEGLTEYTFREAFGDASVASLAVETLSSRAPGLRRIKARVGELSAMAGRAPKRFLTEMGALAPQSRQALLAYVVPRVNQTQTRALSALLGDRAALPIGAGGQAEAAPVVLIEVELIDDVNEPRPGPQTGPATAGRAAKGPPGGELSTAFYVDLVLSGLFAYGNRDDAASVLARWDERATAEVAARVRSADEACSSLNKLSLTAQAASGNTPGARHSRSALDAALTSLRRRCQASPAERPTAGPIGARLGP